jgi:26S proteasome regulatory subunit N3
MPSERRSLRSNKDSTSSSNSGRTRKDSSNSSSSKDKPAPTRAASSKTKTAIARKGSSASQEKDAGSDKRKVNGVENAEKAVNGPEDVEMAEEAADKTSLGKDGEDEMTVVVPPPKGSKLPAEPALDAEGDTAMEASQKAAEDAQPGEDVVDPSIKAVSGKSPGNSSLPLPSPPRPDVMLTAP